MQISKQTNKIKILLLIRITVIGTFLLDDLSFVISIKIDEILYPFEKQDIFNFFPTCFFSLIFFFTDLSLMLILASRKKIELSRILLIISNLSQIILIGIFIINYIKTSIRIKVYGFEGEQIEYVLLAVFSLIIIILCIKFKKVNSHQSVFLAQPVIK